MKRMPLIHLNWRLQEKTAEPWILHDFEEDFYGEELRLVVRFQFRNMWGFGKMWVLPTIPGTHELLCDPFKSAR